MALTRVSPEVAAKLFPQGSIGLGITVEDFAHFQAGDVLTADIPASWTFNSTAAQLGKVARRAGFTIEIPKQEGGKQVVFRIKGPFG